MEYTLPLVFALLTVIFASLFYVYYLKWKSIPPCPVCSPCPTCPACPTCVKPYATYETGEQPPQGTLNIPTSHHYYDCTDFSDPTQLATLSANDLQFMESSKPCVFKNETDAANFCSSHPECISYSSSPLPDNTSIHIPLKNLYGLRPSGSTQFKYKQCQM
jgi:hypothetical protein